MNTITKIAVANRGEIAKRIINTCHQMGLQTVLLHASGDTENEAFRLAGETVCIGSSDILDSYLNIQSNISGALGLGAEAIHPGYGFLSENSEFASECENKGLIFIGPKPEVIDSFGNKIKARKLCEKFGVPVLEGWTGNIKDLKELTSQAKRIGYPLMVKAACGGGGRGLRLAHNEEELKKFVSEVRSEAKISFNSDEVFIEKYLDSAKHIELQVFVSADGKVHILGDRDCSLQRRHQKIIEEAPSSIPENIKKEMKEICREFCYAIGYGGAGTIEFLFQHGKFYFLEMNTRLQVEHTVTEMIFGVDLVRAQILTAMKRPAFFEDQIFEPKGHSLQCRICAEDPSHQFLPAVGTLINCIWPRGLWKRVDSGFQTGDTISIHYDSLIAKIITWDDNRVRNIERMKKTLSETIIFGLPLNVPFLQYVLSHPLFIENKINVDSLESQLVKEWNPEKFPLDNDLVQKIFKNLEIPTKKKERSIFNPWIDF